MTLNFLKVYSIALDSSLWAETSETLKVFLTMGLMADPKGRVFASVGGVARRAMLDPDATAKAIARLESPDPDSRDLRRNPENEGRRIVPIDGGWQLVNAEYYRNLRTEKQEAINERVRRHRDRKRSEKATPAAAAPPPADEPKASRETWLTPYALAYRSTYGAMPTQYGRWAKVLKKVEEEVGHDESVARFERFCALTDLQYFKIETFAEKHPAFKPKGPTMQTPVIDE